MSFDRRFLYYLYIYIYIYTVKLVVYRLDVSLDLRRFEAQHHMEVGCVIKRARTGQQNMLIRFCIQLILMNGGDEGCK